MNQEYECPNCGFKSFVSQTWICPICGLLLTEHIATMNWLKQYEDGQVAEPPVEYPLFLTPPVPVLVGKLPNSQGMVHSAHFCEDNFVEISYNVLVFLGKRIEHNEDEDEGYTLLGAIDDAIDEKLYGPNVFKICMGLRPNEIRNIFYKEKYVREYMIIETTDGLLLEIDGPKELYSLIESWWHGKAFPEIDN